MVPTFITNPKFDLVQYQQMRQTGCSAPLWWVTCSSITTHWTISNWWGSTTLGRTQLRTRGEHASFSYPVPRGWGPNEGCDHSQSFAVCQVGSGYENEALIVYELAISDLPMCRLFYFSESISEHLSNSWSSFDMLENIRQCSSVHFNNCCHTNTWKCSHRSFSRHASIRYFIHSPARLLTIHSLTYPVTY